MRAHATRLCHLATTHSVQRIWGPEIVRAEIAAASSLLLPNFLMSIRLLCDRAAGGAMHVDTYCGAIELGVLCGLHVILLLVKRTHSHAQRSVLCNQQSHDLQMQRQMCWHLFGVTNFT